MLPKNSISSHVAGNVAKRKTTMNARIERITLTSLFGVTGVGHRCWHSHRSRHTKGGCSPTLPALCVSVHARYEHAR